MPLKKFTFLIGHFRITVSLFFKPSLGDENEFNLHVNENSFSTKTRLEKEAKGNSEMVYFIAFSSLAPVLSKCDFARRLVFLAVNVLSGFLVVSFHLLVYLYY